MNVAKLTTPELKALSRRVTSEIAKRQVTGRRDFVKRLEKLAQESGFTLAEVIGAQPAPKAKKVVKAAAKPVNGSKLPIKYWNPLNPNEGWSGHARRPKWVKNWTENGGHLEDLMRRRT